MKSTPATDPAFPFLCLDILGNVLSRADNPAGVGHYLTAELQELTGARCVLFLRRQPPPQGGSRVFCLSPERRSEWAATPAAAQLFADLGERTTLQLLQAGETAGLPQLLQQEGFESAMVVPLNVGAIHVGSLLLLGLPEQNQPRAIITLFGTLSTLVALVMRNAFLFEEQEATIAARTVELRQANAALRQSEQLERDRAQELETVVNTVPALVFIAHDPLCRRTTGNLATRTLLRVQDQDNVSSSAPPGPVPRPFRAMKDGVEIPADQLPTQRAAQGQEVRNYELDLLFADGEQRTILGNAIPLLAADATPRGAIGAFIDITERKRAEAEREALAKELERKNQELESLVYVTSHDLRSPLLNIQGFSQRLGQAGEILQHAAATPHWSEELRREIVEVASDRIPKALGFIHSSVDKMSRLIDGLLRLSRLGRSDLRPERLDLNRILDAIRGAMAHQIQTIDAVVEVDSLPPTAGDATLINQLFTNLLDNAVKYHDPARRLRIHIAGRHEGAQVVYTVADNGRGIPADHLDRIWELFHRVSPNDSVAGEGLGLSLVRRIVERHHGEIRVESVLGQGSRFIITLPAVAAPTKESLP